ncbi:substrate-binding domain-containing protein [Paenibacillus sp. KN14-4R]|uniref:substrate-binding domain-containing protein n=1 Tax=Paenibacillus sp. KN14-4R TaxID=3445773 RepID=UPI003F9EF9E8
MACALDLTTVEHPTFEVGRVACEITHSQITEKSNTPSHQELPIRLIKRSTV